MFHFITAVFLNLFFPIVSYSLSVHSWCLLPVLSQGLVPPVAFQGLLIIVAFKYCVCSVTVLYVFICLFITFFYLYLKYLINSFKIAIS